jgi:hypothetical protein
MRGRLDDSSMASLGRLFFTTPMSSTRSFIVRENTRLPVCISRCLRAWFPLDVRGVRRKEIAGAAGYMQREGQFLEDESGDYLPFGF